MGRMLGVYLQWYFALQYAQTHPVDGESPVCLRLECSTLGMSPVLHIITAPSCSYPFVLQLPSWALYIYLFEVHMHGIPTFSPSTQPLT